HKEGEQTVYESIRLQGAFDNSRAKQLLQTLERMCKRRSLPPGWKVRFVLDPDFDPSFMMKLAAVHAAGKWSYELSHLEPCSNTSSSTRATRSSTRTSRS